MGLTGGPDSLPKREGIGRTPADFGDKIEDAEAPAVEIDCSRTAPRPVLVSANDRGSGINQGQVVDAVGRPIKAARVHAELLGSPMAKAIRYVTADEAGTFLIDRLAFGTYQVFGLKEDEGFPDTSWFSSIEGPRVTISAQQPSGTVLLKFGLKPGVLTGMVRDARTGKPVLAGFTLRRLNDSWFLSSSQPPSFRIFVPASTDVSLEVKAPSYQTRAYMNPTSNSRQLRLEPGSQMHLDITLIPQPEESRIGESGAR